MLKCIIHLSALIALVLPRFVNATDCLAGICIGEDILKVEGIEWVPVDIPPTVQQKYLLLDENASIEDMYLDVNEIFALNLKTKRELAPFIIDLQRFDQQVLDKLRKVEYFCSSTTLIGEVKLPDEGGHTWVTVKVVPDENKKGILRVVQLEKNYELMPSFLRPSDKQAVDMLIKTVKKLYPGVKVVRNIDRIRGADYELAMAKYLFGFRFISDINVPATLRIRDTQDVEPIEYSEQIHPNCLTES